MISSMSDNLTKERIQQLLDAVGKRTSEADLNCPDAVEYDWCISKYFTQEQLKRIEVFAQKISSDIAKNFKNLFHADFEIAVSSVSQHLAGEFAKADDGAAGYWLALAAKDNKIGFFNMPAQTAVIWATQLLGDTKSQQSADRELSQLEMSLLFDISCCAVKALSDVWGESEISPSGEITKNKMPFGLDPIQDVCKITFTAKKSDAQLPVETSFLILSEKLSIAAGQKQTETASQQNFSKVLLEHIQSIPVPLTICFASVNVNIQDLISLSPEDTILLDKTIGQPVDVLYNDKIVFRARPAKFEDSYAVVITELYNKK